MNTRPTAVKAKFYLGCAAALGAAGYAVDVAADGDRADLLASCEAYDAVVLDLGLPRVDGLTLLRRWRENGLVLPVLILTARGSWHEKVLGIDGGADDDVITNSGDLNSVYASADALGVAVAASAALPNTAIMPSPVVFTTRPPDPSMAARRIASWRFSAIFMASGNRSQSCVLPSRSENRKVIVTVAGRFTPPIIHPSRGVRLPRSLRIPSSDAPHA